MKKILIALLAVIMVFLLCSCRVNTSVYDVDKTDTASDKGKGVATEHWKVREYEDPEINATQYRLYKPTKPADSVVPLATTAFSVKDCNLDKIRSNEFLNEKYDLKDACREEGVTETYADGVFTSYLVQDFLVGRYKNTTGDFADFTVSVFYDTSMIENSYSSISLEFRNIFGNITQDEISDFVKSYLPEDIAEALVYGADKDGLGEDGEAIDAGCLYETVTSGKDTYALIRTVTDTDNHVNVSMQASLEELNGAEELFDKNTDWTKVNLFEHYDGGYSPLVNDLKDLMSDNIRAIFAGIGTTELRSNRSFDKYFSFSPEKHGMTKPQGYVYSETPTDKGVVRTLSAKFQNCMDGVTNSQAPVLSIDVADVLGRTTVTITDNVGYVSGNTGQTCEDLFSERMSCLFGQKPLLDTSLIPYATAVPFDMSFNDFSVSGFVAQNTDSLGTSMSYTIIITEKEQ